jgi:hypothetical protein
VTYNLRNQSNLTDIIFKESSNMDMYISIELHDHILNSVFLALLIGVSVGLIIGMNTDIIRHFLVMRFKK